jgi:MerR family mercuric resistance operon transcriptional regulator
MDTRDLLTIGELAERGEVNAQTIRYYERCGLLPKPRRSPSGYRLYDQNAAKRLSFVRRAQALGFSLREINDLLSLRLRADTTCADIRDAARQKIASVDGKLAELNRIRAALVRLARSCRGSGPKSECPILEALDQD